MAVSELVQFVITVHVVSPREVFLFEVVIDHLTEPLSMQHSKTK